MDRKIAAGEFTLSPDHMKKLETESGITEEIAISAGLKSLGGNNYKLYGVPGPGLLLPYIDFSKNFLGNRLRLDTSIVHTDGTKQRYWQKKGSSLTCYFLPKAIDKITNPKIPLIIVEGEKKALSLESQSEFAGHAIIAVPGCWNWKKGGEPGMSGMLKQIPFQDRKVFIIPDSNAFTNPYVWQAYESLAMSLFDSGAYISLIDLRALDNGGSADAN